MPEAPNAEIAHKLAESHGHPRGTSRREALVETAEAIVLAVVAVAAAWSGYQAARWDGRQAERYATSSRLRVQAGEAATEGGQQRLLDVVTFNTWVQAHEAGDAKLEAIYVRRFSQEYRVAFEAWLRTDPFHDPGAPAGPAYMPQYRNAQLERAATLNVQATAAFGTGTHAREVAERYVAATVLLAMVLFLIAISQRFVLSSVRLGILVAAGVVLVFVLASMSTYPRA
jgi:hypothetical protein